MGEPSQPFLELSGISKTYPGVVALNDVSLSVGRGEIVGLIGENGAGKSTLMKVLGGVIAPTTGTIKVDGREHAALTVNDAIKGGIAFVHQELNLFDNLDVAGNVFIGREPLYGGPLRLLDTKQLHRQVQPLLDKLGVDFAPDTPVADLSLAQKQLLEIAKALLPTRLEHMSEALSRHDWLAGDHYSLADLAVFPTVSQLPGLVPAMVNDAVSPAIMAWLERMRARPAVRQARAMARTPDPDAVFAPGPEGSRWG